MTNHEFKSFEACKPEDLHDKIGQFKFIRPSDSDINEGNFMARLWFMDKECSIYLINEWDLRKDQSNDR